MTIDTNKEPRIRGDKVFDFIDMCNRNDVAIIGIEGGRVYGKSFVPDIDLIADTTVNDNNWRKYRKACNDGAAIYFDSVELTGNVVFVMTIINESEFEKLYGISK